jgi:Domain of unknown function (DUF4167)
LSNNRGNNRRRGRGNNRPQGGQQLNRIDSRARGNAPQLLEKYRKLAHDAHLNGDRVNEEYYLQFADHYFRVIADTRVRQDDSRQRRDDRWQEGGDGYREDGDEAGEYGSESGSAGESQDRGYTSRGNEFSERASFSDRTSDETGGSQDEGAEGARESSQPAIEPAENPFLRDRAGQRGLKPRYSRRDSREGEEAGETGGLDPSSLPPSISAARDEPGEAGADEPAAEAKPRRRTRRKPPADEELQSVG